MELNVNLDDMELHISNLQDIVRRVIEPGWSLGSSTQISGTHVRTCGAVQLYIRHNS
jgi:hypothetical protein